MFDRAVKWIRLPRVTVSAATVILGTSFSGNDRWRDKKGVTLGKRLGKG